MKHLDRFIMEQEMTEGQEHWWKSSDFDDTVVSGTKTSVPISDVLKKEKTN